ncbi:MULTISPECIES: hypothetical protein [Nocardiopsis]|jgi:hypothetical protein|uniref:Integral membrane protein n=1 Tax=Nocardiopsis sinuspersici TaxID=501010 RepID=A0A1V3C068_9ACTN|nr:MULTISPECIES: hypothetical protein [Nocardiopsis]NYH55591.1 hypothetical protein [Nocardiopsis sinuspersici]OOC54201.1 hypothetical protein NOSIN_10610 [Nocardiopsis sinuspersici]
MTHTPPEPRDEVAAALRAGRELGPEYDDAVAASLVERIDDTIAERVRHHMSAQDRAAPVRTGTPSNTVRFVLSLVCLGVSIPVSAITAALGNPAALPLVWLGLILFYLVSVVGLRR